MRDYGKISTAVWRSQKFKSLKSDNHKLFYLYLHTCPHVNSVGCFWLPTGYAAADLKWEENEVIKAIDSLSQIGMISYDNNESIIYIDGFLSHSPVTNVKHAFGSAKIALSLSDCDLKELVLNDLLIGPFGKDVKTKIDAMPEVNRRKFSSAERRKVYEKSSGSCEYCKSELSLFALDVTPKKPYMTIDHIKPISLGGGNELANLNASCLSCNSKKGVEAYQYPIDTTEPEPEPLPETDSSIISDDINKKSKSKRGTRIPENWLPDENDINHAIKKDYDNDQIKELGNGFRDHWIAATGKGSTSLDWNAKWRTWISNDIKWHGSPSTRNSTRNLSPHESLHAGAALAVSMLDGTQQDD